MITVHHLNNSRSQRILWLLEELGTPYEIVFHQRDAVTSLAPPELKAVHPLGKSPVVVADGEVLAESGAIIDILARRAGSALAPDFKDPLYVPYAHWLHFAEGSAMLPFLLALYTSRLGENAAPLMPRIQSEIANHLDYVNAALKGREFLLGDTLSGADIQMSFVGEIARGQGLTAVYTEIGRWVQTLHARPQWRTALQKGGPYHYGD